MSKALLVLTIFLSIIPSLIGCAPIDPLTETVLKADLIVLGTVTDNRSDVVSVVSGNSTVTRAYTFFTLSVEKILKGDPSLKEAIIRLPGGPISGMYQVPTEGYFFISDHVLVSLAREDSGIYTLFAEPLKGRDIPIHGNSGILWIQGTTAMSEAPQEEIIGRICKILRINNIPNSLNEPCAQPTEPAARPQQ